MLFIILSILLNCGYHFGIVLLTGDSKISIDSISNKTFYPIENSFRTELEQAFYSNGLTIGKSSTSLNINILTISKKATSFSSTNSPEEYKMTVSIEYKIIKKDKEIKKGKINDYGLYRPDSQEENKALTDAIKKISQKIVENSIDKW